MGSYGEIIGLVVQCLEYRTKTGETQVQIPAQSRRLVGELGPTFSSQLKLPTGLLWG